MLRRTFLKTIAAAAAAVMIPLSVTEFGSRADDWMSLRFPEPEQSSPVDDIQAMIAHVNEGTGRTPYMMYLHPKVAEAMGMKGGRLVRL